MHHTPLTTTVRYTTLSVAALLAAMGLGTDAAYAAQSAQPACLNSRFADGHMLLHFDAPKSADHIVLSTYNAPAHTIVRISDGVHSVALAAGSSQEARTEAELRAPLQGSDFTVTIDNVAISDDAVCITEVQLAAGEQQLTPALASLPSAVVDEAPNVIGTWQSCVSNFQASTLRIAADGSWQLQTSRGLQQGSWQYRGQELLMRLGTNGSFVPMHLISQSVSPSVDERPQASANAHTVLMLSAALIPELGGTFSQVVAD